jgi:hypothetical protein
LIVFVVVFLDDFTVTVTFTTQVPVFTATIFPELTLQYFAEEYGTLAVTLAPVGTLRFAVLAILKNVAGLLPLRVIDFAVVGDT